MNETITEPPTPAVTPYPTWAPSPPAAPNTNSAPTPVEMQAAAFAPWQEVIEVKNREVLEEGRLVRPASPTHVSAARRLLARASFGLVPEESPHEVRLRELTGRITVPLPDHHRIAVLSLKGGVGKTTTCLGVGSVLASLRESRVIAVDGNPDRGTLGDRVQLTTSFTVRQLNADADSINRYTQMRRYTSANDSRLQILPSDTAGAEQYDADSYKVTADLLEQHYDLVLTDCGTGLRHSAMASILGLADLAVIVLEPALDAARSADSTLEWLIENGYRDLAANAVVVVSGVEAKTRRSIDLDRVIAHFRPQVHEIVEVPFDDHLDLGGIFRLDALHPSTRNAYMQVAALIAGQLSQKTTC